MNSGYFTTLARYNRWANRRLYAAVVELDDAAYRADQGAFFRSLHGTLNHILVADRLWMARLTGAETAPMALDAILYDDFSALAAARAEEDEHILAFVEGLSEARLADTLRYTNSKGQPFADPLALVLGHVFNHQTHHRGQAHAILTRLVGRAPELDLIYFVREEGAAL